MDNTKNLAKRQYSFIRKDGVYATVMTDYPYVAVFGTLSSDRQKALRKAREHCRNNFATLHIEA